ncbi:MAG: Glycosyltransferase AglJ [Candidatus Bathyarchaeota archaeon BA1]|nr:MAG: Glycosyltransferase AglJ [Candidatus Bathyarchaeota archaeon BA1]
MRKICIIIPTYNERENIVPLISELQNVLKHCGMERSATVLIVDDNSPDGTGKLAEEMARIYGNLRVLHRPRKSGLGSAYRDGFSYALNKLDSDVIFEMDADLSHNPKQIPNLLDGILNGCDVVVGSRRVEGGGIVGWSPYRRMVSWFGNRMAQWLCGVRARDATSGYRAFTRKALEQVNYLDVKSEGYAFQIEMLFRCQEKGLGIEEKPIIFIDRGSGKSKLGTREWIEFMKTCFKLLISRLKAKS